MRDTFIEWLILINIITFVIYALDKYKAVHHLWRIPEKTLIFFIQDMVYLQGEYED